MKRIVALSMIAAGFLWSLWIGSAHGRPQYPKFFEEEYKGQPIIPAAAGAKCNLCHDPKNKKIRNDYGKAVNKGINADDFNMLKGMKAALEKKFSDALKQAEKEKNAEGKPFGDNIKKGILP